jgi:putative AlgH/UPF0301 family transcriptional regulator
VYVVVLRREGPRWVDGAPLEDQTGWASHATFMDGLVLDGVVVLGGPLEDDRRVVLVVEATSKSEVRTLLAEDPWANSHLVLESIDEWTIRLDGRVTRDR